MSTKTIAALAPMALLFASSVFAQDKPVRRLEGVTWNPAEHKLSWTVVVGKNASDGKFDAKEKLIYEIDMDAAIMSTSGQDRRFSKQEAVRVHALMDMVAKYAAESTIWWDAGEGEPVNGKERDKSQVRRDFHQRRQQPAEVDDGRERPAPKQPGVKVIRIALQQTE